MGFFEVCNGGAKVSCGKLAYHGPEKKFGHEKAPILKHERINEAMA